MCLSLRTLRRALCSTLLLTLLLLFGIRAPMVFAQEGDSEKASQEASDEGQGDPFVVPEGNATELIAFIDGLLEIQPKERTRQAYQEHGRKVSVAWMEASGRILAGKATDEQLAKAVETRFRALQFAEYTGDKDAVENRQKFVESLQKDGRPALLAAMRPFQLGDQAQKWAELDDKGKAGFHRNVVKYFQKTEVGQRQYELAQQIGQLLESQDTEAAQQFYNVIVPAFASSSDPKIVGLAERFAGVARRIGLKGNKMEIKATTLGGKEFDWQSYRGKVVLVDFWATWCGPCRAEVPNIKQNYAAYHKKGFDVVAISLDTPGAREQVQAYVDSEEIPWAVLFSDDETAEESSLKVAEYYAIDAIPAMFLVGKDGKVVTLSARGRALGRCLRELLGKPLPIEDDEPEDDADED